MANRLKNETSHYLLQHANNPVNWYPWGEEAFQRAELENKPVIVSIGYAACHWCHVMERESFEDEATAAYMNEHFICIKVDREERPDVDHLYMDAVQGLTGAGGWPLNVFATPERIPFYGGTYYPPRPAYSRPSWMQIMQKMTTVWHEQHDQVNMQATQMLNFLRQTAAGVSTQPEHEINNTGKIAEQMLQSADMDFGGFGSAPKFPAAMAISYLIEHYYFTGNKKGLNHALDSLDAMAAGGIYDQIGGGFARYSTDREWLVPHFEKMLYDNALLIIAYADAYSVTGNQTYRVLIQQTIGFVNRELKGPEGGYYCALDADSEGEEGKFYVWTWEEWNEVLGDDAGLAATIWGVTIAGNFEGVNILNRPVMPELVAGRYNISPEEVRGKIEKMRTVLFNARAKRVRPLTDDKRLLSWNALMNLALTKAGRALGDNDYLTEAEQHMRWMVATYKAENWLRTWKDGEARIPANLEDLAYLAQAMLQISVNGGNTGWIQDATHLIELIIAQYSSTDGVDFYYTSVYQKDIPVRKIDVYDGATPSANAFMAQNLLICGLLTENSEWTSRARHMLNKMYQLCLRSGTSFGYWALQLQRADAGYKTLVVSGKQTETAINQLKLSYLPEFLLIRADKNQYQEGVLKNKFSHENLHIFVCSETACFAPLDNVDEALVTAKNIAHS